MSISHRLILRNKQRTTTELLRRRLGSRQRGMYRLAAEQTPRKSTYETEYFLFFQCLHPKFVPCLLIVFIHYIYRMIVIGRRDFSNEFAALTDDSGSDYLSILHLKPFE